MNLDWVWLDQHLGGIGRLTVEHIVLAILPVLVAFVVSLPLGYALFRAKKGATPVLAVLGMLSSIPALALFVLLPLVVPFRIPDRANIIVALAIYSTALLVGSVIDGLRSVPPLVTQSASAMGYGWLRRLFGVELPLAMPAIFAGLRVVTVSNIALVSVAAIIGSGALGTLFALGFGSSAPFYTPIIVGLVLTLLLALIFDAVIRLIQRGALPWARGRQAA